MRPRRRPRDTEPMTWQRSAWMCVCVLAISALAGGARADRPNILWITTEDMSPHLGAYGDLYARTPHIDRLASQGVRYTHAFAPTGVCAPSRSTLIAGMHAPTIGTQHMRSQRTLPPELKLYPQLLRAAGYYATNNEKQDYNLVATPADAWDDSSKRAHYRNRKDPRQPF